MIIVLKPHCGEQDIEVVADVVRSMRYQPRIIRGVEHTVIACVGDELSNGSLESLKNHEAVDSVLPIQHRYKLVSREYHPKDTVVTVGNTRIGNGSIAVMAGPCAMESAEQFRTAVDGLQALGIRIIRAMPYKPRTSPYDFQGLRADGVRIMHDVKAEFDVSFLSEVMGPAHVESLREVADIFQIGARNAQNYDLLEEVAHARKPVLLKRGPASTVEEWLAAAEYLMVNGCEDVMLCERGLRSFDRSVRNLLDLSGVAVAKRATHLPILVDPSHAAGKRDLVLPLSRAALGAGADGLVIEAHPNPATACSDAAQQIEIAQMGAFMQQLAPWMELAKTLRNPAETEETP